MPSRCSAHRRAFSQLGRQFQGPGVEIFRTPTRCGCTHQDSIRICAYRHKRTIKRPAASRNSARRIALQRQCRTYSRSGSRSAASRSWRESVVLAPAMCFRSSIRTRPCLPSLVLLPRISGWSCAFTTLSARIGVCARPNRSTFVSSCISDEIF